MSGSSPVLMVATLEDGQAWVRCVACGALWCGPFAELVQAQVEAGMMNAFPLYEPSKALRELTCCTLEPEPTVAVLDVDATAAQARLAALEHHAYTAGRTAGWSALALGRGLVLAGRGLVRYLRSPVVAGSVAGAGFALVVAHRLGAFDGVAAGLGLGLRMVVLGAVAIAVARLVVDAVREVASVRAHRARTAELRRARIAAAQADRERLR